MAVSIPKQRFSPRATLYSPPPSQTSNVRVVWIRRSPGSSRSMTSPRLTMSQRHSSLGFIFNMNSVRKSALLFLSDHHSRSKIAFSFLLLPFALSGPSSHRQRQVYVREHNHLPMTKEI